MKKLIAHVTKGQVHSVPTPPGVEITYREDTEVKYCFILNHTKENQKLQLPEAWESYFPNQIKSLIPAYGYQVYTVSKEK